MRSFIFSHTRCVDLSRASLQERKNKLEENQVVLF